MNITDPQQPAKEDQIQQEIKKINFSALKKIDPTVKELILTCKVCKLLEYLDVWHSKEIGPTFLVEKQSSDNTRKYAIIKLNQEEINDDLIINLTQNIGFGYHDSQQMIYLKEAYEYGFWMAETQEYVAFRDKISEIIQDIKAKSIPQQHQSKM